MPGQLAVLPHLSGKRENAAQLLRARGRRTGSVLGRQAESGEGTVIGDLLKRLGEALEAFAIIDGLRRLEQAFPAGRLLRVLNGLKRGATRKGEPAVRLIDALRCEPAKRDVRGRNRDGYGDTAAANRGKKPGRAVRDEDKDGPERWLLQAFQERVSGIRIEVLGGMDERDAQGAAVRAQVEEVGEGAHLLHRDDDARLLGAPGRGLAPLLRCLGFRRWHLRERFGLDAPEVRMVAGEIPAAGVAAPAGTRLRIGVLAQEQLREVLGERELADAARAVDQERVRKALARLLERVEDCFVPGVHQRPASAPLICSRTSPAVREASMTRIRRASIRASSRY